MDMSAISGLLSSLNAVKDLTQTMIGLRDSQAIQAKLLEFQAELLKANGSALATQQEQFALLETVRELKEELARLKNWEAEKQRYQLTEVGLGAVAYTLKPGMENGEPPHTICANCYNRGQKSFLQPETRFPGRTKHIVCHECGSDLIVAGGRDAMMDAPRPQAVPVRHHWGRR